MVRSQAMPPRGDKDHGAAGTGFARERAIAGLAFC